MQPYATNSQDRRRVTWVVFLISLTLTFVVHLGLAHTSLLDTLWWFGAPSLAAIYTLLYWLAETYGWRWRVLHSVGFIAIPDLNGTWRGELLTSFDEFKTPIPVSIVIGQTLSKIRVQLRTATSRSENVIAGITVYGPTGAELIYVYDNRPEVDALGTMRIHRGTQALTYDETGGAPVLSGPYYNDGQRKTTGKITVRRASGESPLP